MLTINNKVKGNYTLLIFFSLVGVFQFLFLNDIKAQTDEEKGLEIKAKAKAIRQEFPERHRAANRAYRDANPGKGAARRANYLAALKKRTPEWANLEEIEFFYVCRPEGYDVDHIAPLQGEFNSGLHVVENLQWLPERVNIAKGNYWNSDEGAMADYMRRLIRDNL